MIIYQETNPFKKDFKKLLKRFPSLKEDLEGVKRNAIEVHHLLKIDNQSVFLTPQFGDDKVQIYKVKKFACRSLKGRGVKSGLRLIYAYWVLEKRIEMIEIYFKGDKENEDVERIKKYWERVREGK